MFTPEELRQAKIFACLDESECARLAQTVADVGNSIATRSRWRRACQASSAPATRAITPSNEYRVEWAKAVWPSRLSINI